MSNIVKLPQKSFVINTPRTTHVVPVTLLRSFVNGEISLQDIPDSEEMMRSICHKFIEVMIDGR